MINKNIYIGRLTRDPDIKVTTSGHTVCKFTIAVDNGYGEKKKTEFVPCTAWGKLAEICGQYLLKGSLIYAEGRRETETWENEKGKQYRVNTVLETMIILSSKKDENTQPQNSTEQEYSDDDVPF